MAQTQNGDFLFHHPISQNPQHKNKILKENLKGKPLFNPL